MIDELDPLPSAGVRRVVFCSGKVYFDLLQARRAEQRRTSRSCVSSNSIRFRPGIPAVLARYSNAAELVWCQEEPQNQGAWFQIRHRLQEFAGAARPVHYAGRAPAAAPATGLARLHQAEQQALVQAALSAATGEASAPPLPRRRNPDAARRRQAKDRIHESRDSCPAAARICRRRDLGRVAQAAR